MANSRKGPDAAPCQDLQSLKIMYTNARSLVNKINELKLLVNDCRPDIIALTETWTHDGISNLYLKIPNYFIAARHDRQDTINGRGGGLLIYVNDKFQSVETTSQNDFNQHCSIQITSNSGSLNLYVIYRSPNSNATNNRNLINVER